MTYNSQNQFNYNTPLNNTFNRILLATMKNIAKNIVNKNPQITVEKLNFEILKSMKKNNILDSKPEKAIGYDNSSKYNKRREKNARLKIRNMSNEVAELVLSQKNESILQHPPGHWVSIYGKILYITKKE